MVGTEASNDPTINQDVPSAKAVTPICFGRSTLGASAAAGRTVVRSHGLSATSEHVRFGIELLVGWIVVSAMVWAVLAFTVTVPPPGSMGEEVVPSENGWPNFGDDPADIRRYDPLLPCNNPQAPEKCVHDAM